MNGLDERLDHSQCANEDDCNGPCKIVQQTSRGTYHLQNEQGKLLKQAVSSNCLKLYIEQENRSEEQEEGEEKEKREERPRRSKQTGRG